MIENKIKTIDILSLLCYSTYIILIALVSYYDRRDIGISSLLRIPILFLNILIPFIYRYLLNIRIKNLFIYIVIISTILIDILFSLFINYRDAQTYRLLSFLLSFPTTYLLFFVNLEYKNKYSSYITKIQIFFTIISASIISLSTPTLTALDSFTSQSVLELVEGSNYNSSSVEIYYVSLLILYASFLRLKLYINKDKLNLVQNLLILIILIPTFKLAAITYASMTGIALILISFNCFYIFSLVKTNKSLLLILISIIGFILKDYIITFFKLISLINSSQTDTFPVRIKYLTTFISPYSPFIGEGSCPVTFNCNHAHNVFTDLSVTLGLFGFILMIFYIYYFFHALIYIKMNNHFRFTLKNKLFYRLYFSSFLLFVFILSLASEIPLYWATFSFLPFLFSNQFFEKIYQISQKNIDFKSN